MKTFIIHADQKFSVWQSNVFIINAENKEEAKDRLRESASEFCVETETLDSTEEFIETDFENNFEIEER